MEYRAGNTPSFVATSGGATTRCNVLRIVSFDPTIHELNLQPHSTKKRPHIAAKSPLH